MPGLLVSPAPRRVPRRRRRADVDRTWNGISSLGWSCIKGHLGVVQHLSSYGASRQVMDGLMAEELTRSREPPSPELML